MRPDRISIKQVMNFIASIYEKGSIKPSKRNEEVFQGGRGLLVLPFREEDRLTDLIVYAISRAIEKQEFPRHLGNAKITKIVYDVAESLELPITRSWYKFGTYVWTDYAKEDRLNQFLGKNLPSTDIQGTISLAQRREKKNLTGFRKKS